MSWSKIKTIIIAILLLTNLFLLFLIGSQKIHSARYEADTLRQTVEVLALNGLKVAEDALPDAVQLSPLSVSRDEQAEAQAAGILLSEDIISNSTGGLNVYSSVAGNLSFRSGGEVSATLDLPWSGFDSPADHAAYLMEQLGTEVWTISVDNDTVTVTQMVGEVPVFDAQLTLVYGQFSLLSMEGKLLLGTSSAESEPYTSISLATALVALMNYSADSGTAFSTITRMTPGYLAAASLTDPIRLSPGWLVETDAANFYIDAATGEVSRAE